MARKQAVGWLAPAAAPARPLLQLVAAILAIALIGSPVAAASNPAAIRTFPDLLQVALTTAKDVKLADYQLQQAEAGLAGVKARLAPQLSLQGDAVTEKRTGLPDNVNTYSGTLIWAQQLGPNTQLRGALQKGEIGALSAQMQKEKAVADLVGAVQGGYFALADAYDMLQLAELSQEVAAERLRIARTKQAEGTASALDVLEAQNDLLQAEKQADTARMNLEVAVLSLWQRAGLDGDLAQGRAWTEQLLASQSWQPSPWQVDFDRALAYALEHRIDLLLVRKQVELAEVDYQTSAGTRDWKAQVGAQYSPDGEFAVGATLDSEQLLTASVISSRLSGMPGMTAFPAEWQVKLGVSWQFSDGGAHAAELKVKKAAWDAAATQLALAQDGVRLELYAKWRQLGQAWQSYLLAQEGQRVAKEAYRQVQALYDLGSATAQDVRDADLAVRQADVQALAAARAYEQQKTQLAIAMGIGVQELVEAAATGNWQLLTPGAEAQ